MNDRNEPNEVRTDTAERTRVELFLPGRKFTLRLRSRSFLHTRSPL